ncbi:hypothetical protein OH735_03285 [Streptomyces sp. NBC_01618]|nr:hypothetical protein OH735_03285 [Streptomyces sp. NBC_01618]
MAFFTTQFLHTLPGQRPELYSAVALSLLTSSSWRRSSDGYGCPWPRWRTR